MLSFHVKFVQADGQKDRQMDNGKTICPSLSIRGHKNKILLHVRQNYFLVKKTHWTGHSVQSDLNLHCQQKGPSETPSSFKITLSSANIFNLD